MNNRIKYLDGLRFFAILNIILIHVLAIFRFKYFSTSKITFFILTLFDSFTRVGVPLFFMLTGVLMLAIKTTKENYVEFFKKRIVKLIVVYIFFSLIYYIYNVIKGYTNFSVLNFLSQLTSGQIKYHLWFMPVIIMIYIFIPFLKKFVLHLKKYEIKNLILIIFITGNIFIGINSISTLMGYSLLQNFIVPNLLIYINYLFMGYYIYKYNLKIDKKLIILSILSIILMPILTTLISRTEINDLFLNAISPLTIFPSILVFELFKNYYHKIKLPKFIDNFIAKNSKNILYVYLWHVLILTIPENYFEKNIVKTSALTDILFILIYYFFTIIVSFIVAIIWSKTKQIILKYKNNISKFLIKTFFIVFSIIFIIILINLIINKYNFIKINYLLYIVGIVITTLLFYLLNKYQNKIFSNKIIKIFMIIIYVLFQIIFIKAFMVKPSWDFGTVYNIAVRFATGKGKLNTEYYLYMCDNNIGIATIYSLIFKLFYILGIKNSFLTIGLVINCLCIDIGLFYTYLMLKKISKESAKPYFIFCSLFSPLICYLPIFYTDTFTLPFVATSIYYLYIYIYEKQKAKYLVIAGLLLGIGGIVKPTALIILLALIVFLILDNKKSNQINYYKFFTILFTFLMIPFISYKIYVKYYFYDNNFYNSKIPMNHYIMMGLKDNGGFNQDDYEYTSKIVGIDNKKKADNRILKSRLKKKITNNTLISFYNKKISYTWTDGTFFAWQKLIRYPKNKKNVKYISSNDNSDILYWTISNVEWSILILLMIVGAILRKYLPEKLQEIQFITDLSIFGLLLFLLLWETRSRYILNFTPCFIISGYIGIQSINNFFKKYKKRQKN